MVSRILRQRWLPLLVTIIGLIISGILWYILHLDTYTRQIETYHPWLGLGLGIIVTILVAAIVRSTQLALERARSLKRINVDLKKEIAERVSAEATKEKLEAALLQGQKLQAIGTLASGIAHDFNNILYAIIGYVEMARDDTAPDSLTYKNLGKVLDGAHRGQELVSRILAFSRRQHHQFEILDVKFTIDAALSLLKPTIPTSVMIRFNAIQNIKIKGNQTQIHQVMVNLINNAVDAMDAEGSITITMERVLAEDPLLKEFPEAKPQNYCKIEIKDTGHGMDKKTIERIFDPFFTTKEVGQGTGLGLSIVHTIVKEHDGEITVNSQLGHGTQFIILIPEYLS